MRKTIDASRAPALGVELADGPSVGSPTSAGPGLQRRAGAGLLDRELWQRLGLEVTKEGEPEKRRAVADPAQRLPVV